jgi:hypothetical protein
MCSARFGFKQKALASHKPSASRYDYDRVPTTDEMHMTDSALPLSLPVGSARSNFRTIQHPSAELPALMHCHGRSQSVVIRRISREGMTVEYASGLKLGDPLMVQLFSNRTLAGSTVWSVAGYCGIAFDTPLADDDPLLLSQC